MVGPVTELVADCEHLALEGVDVEDAVHLIARHGRVLASYNLNQFQAPNETTIQVVCERGTVRFEAHNNRWQWVVAPEEPWHVEQFPTMERDALFVAQANAFLDAIANQSSPLCSLAEGEQTLRVNLAALESATTRSWRSIDI
jgi:predicted dehydrogenase